MQENELIGSDNRFEDSGIGHGTSSQLPEAIISSSPVSEDQGFSRRSPIPGRFQGAEAEGAEEKGAEAEEEGAGEAEMKAQFEQQQREREWLASGVIR